MREDLHFHWDSAGAHTPYCLGSDKVDAEGNPVSSCMLPQTQVTGDFRLNIGAEPIQTIMAASNGSNTHEFKFIVTGDNDLDCKSSAFSFRTKVTYVVPGAM